MIDFAEARQIVAADVKAGGERVAEYGRESDDHWFPEVLPVRIGGRVPAVAKQDGALSWMNDIEDEYTSARPYGADGTGGKT